MGWLKTFLLSVLQLEPRDSGLESTFDIQILLFIRFSYVGDLQTFFVGSVRIFLFLKARRCQTENQCNLQEKICVSNTSAFRFLVCMCALAQPAFSFPLALRFCGGVRCPQRISFASLDCVQKYKKVQQLNASNALSSGHEALRLFVIDELKDI